MNTQTHKYITDLAIKILNNKEINKHKEALVYYAAQPDFDENEGAYKFHFYNPATHKSFADEYNSALSRCCKYYIDGINNYSKNDTKYIECLGRSIHYLVDLNTPVHTYNQDVFDAVVNVSSHVAFEKKCDNLIDKYTISNAPQINNVNYFDFNNIIVITENCALNASVLFDKYINMDVKREFTAIADASLINSIKNTIGILYKFYSPNSEV